MITIYTTKNCAQCVPVKKYLTMQNIDYKEIDVTDDTEKRSELYDLTGYTRVPVTVRGSKFVVGYDIGKLKGLFV
jgi:glutaredoxin